MAFTVADSDLYQEKIMNALERLCIPKEAQDSLLPLLSPAAQDVETRSQVVLSLLRLLEREIADVTKECEFLTSPNRLLQNQVPWTLLTGPVEELNWFHYSLRSEADYGRRKSSELDKAVLDSLGENS